MAKYLIRKLNLSLSLSLGVLALLGTSVASSLEAEEPLIPNETGHSSSSRVSAPVRSHTEHREYSNNTDAGCGIAKQPISLQFDRYLSPTAGASLMMSLNNTYKMLDDTLVPSTEGDRSLALMAGRFANILFIQGTVVGLEMIAQHEVFGHGFRMREFHLPNRSYKVTPWSGSSSFNSVKYNQLSLHEKIAVSTGGMEANNILSKEIRSNWLENDVIDSRDAHLYFLAAIDQPEYVLDSRGHEDKNFPAGHDVMEYIQDVNQWHQKKVLSTHRLRQRVLIDFLDPFLYFSLYSVGQYIVEGSHSFEYPMISIGEYKYLPLMRTSLAPYGSEYQLINLIKAPESVIQATLRYGNTGGKHSSGLGVEVANFFKYDLLRLDGKVDLWNQPKMFTANASSAKSKFGGALSLIGRYRIVDKVDLIGQAGYKTTGFMQGEVLKHSPILRVGFAAYL